MGIVVTVIHSTQGPMVYSPSPSPSHKHESVQLYINDRVLSIISYFVLFLVPEIREP